MFPQRAPQILYRLYNLYPIWGPILDPLYGPIWLLYSAPWAALWALAFFSGTRDPDGLRDRGLVEGMWAHGFTPLTHGTDARGPTRAHKGRCVWALARGYQGPYGLFVRCGIT